MYRPQMATWFKSLVQRLPLRAMPTKEQVEIARDLAGQPLHQGMVMSRLTAEMLVNAQFLGAGGYERMPPDDEALDQLPHSSSLPMELMAACSWNREMLCPDPFRLAQLCAEPVLPDGALAALAALPMQTYYIVIDRPALDTFMSGVWILADIKADTEDAVELLVMPDLVTQGEPLRDIVYSFPIMDSYAQAVDAIIEDNARTMEWDAAAGAHQLRENMRQYLSPTKVLLAIAYDTLVVNRARVEALRATAIQDELNFTLLNLSGEPVQMAAGAVH